MKTQIPHEDKHTDTDNEANPQSVLEKHGADLSEKESDTIHENPAPTDMDDCAVKEVVATNMTETRMSLKPNTAKPGSKIRHWPVNS